MDAKERILYYANTKGVNASSLEKQMSLSRNYFRNTAKVSVEVVASFLSVYSEVSPEWILTGSGEMIKQPKDKDMSGNISTLEAEKSFLEKEFFYLKAIRDKNADLIKAMDKIEEKEKEILRLKAEIESLKGMLDKLKVV
jgi:putative phage repressor